ncbi:MAG: glycosyltransferase [Clostridiales bacterium]|nr:glycosyltransferase [Clostridiales bacterium]
MARTLVYFSSCAIHPDGKNDPFMKMEQPWLVAHFHRVYMAAYQGVDVLTADPDQPHRPRRPLMSGLRGLIRALFSGDVWTEWKHLRKDGVFSLVNALKVLLFAARGQRMALSLKKVLKQCRPEKTTLYSCWMSFDAYAAALLKRAYPQMRFVVRGHAFDIDAERNSVNPYLMKQTIARAADGVYLISEMARQQYMAYMRGQVDESKVHVLAFGSAGDPPDKLLPPPVHTEGVLRIASCAKVIPIKQVDILLEALAAWEGVPVHWTHIGDGEGFDQLKARAEELLDQKENVIFHLLGGMATEQVVATYEQQAFDVFVNTSRKEGVPVSIMEAMRCGIPAIAPRVGGLPELVTEETGWLYEPGEGQAGVLRCLSALTGENLDLACQRRTAAARRWKEKYRNTASLETLLPEGLSR